MEKKGLENAILSLIRNLFRKFFGSRKSIIFNFVSNLKEKDSKL